MTAVERYPSPKLDFSSDARSNAPRTHTTLHAIARNIPPAVPSPPQAVHSAARRPRERSPTGEFKAVTMATQEPSQWLFTDTELASTPSILDGLPAVEERCRRAKGVNFILQAGIMLKLPQLTLATASVFFHRFYMRQNMVPEKGGLHHYNIAATSLFLATKSEENCRKTKEIVIAVAKVAQKNASLIIDEQSKEYWRWRDSILLYEELMLELLTFDVVLQSPYNWLYEDLHKLHLQENKEIRNVAWAFLNDSILTTMCLSMPARDIAIASLYFAAKFNRVKIPDSENTLPWWEYIGGSPELITKAISIINEFYNENPLKRHDNPYVNSPGSMINDEDLDSTRSRGDLSFGGEYPSPDEPGQSQRSQNGHAEDDQNGTPLLNGSKSEHQSETPAAEAISTAHTNGASDAALKEAANDPSTHTANGNNNLADLLPTEPAASQEEAINHKRKASNTADDSLSKKTKTEDRSGDLAAAATSPKASQTQTAKDEESEEGELDE